MSIKLYSKTFKLPHQYIHYTVLGYKSMKYQIHFQTNEFEKLKNVRLH